MARSTVRMAQSPHSPETRRRAHWIGIATAIMCALAGGAIWCLLALYTRHDLIALAIPIAGVIVWTLRAHEYGGSWQGAVIAAVCVAISCTYSLCLQASAQVASLLGLSLSSVLLRIDVRMALDIAIANVDRPNALLMIVALVIAVAGTAWPAQRRID
ncbi:MAG TPA: hypothetical protein VJ696_04445 [Rhodanobacteraceae bacterium]|nr:hypothetical protein [Rhodanobacteraceae bacterium]